LGGRVFVTLKFHTGLLGSARRSLVDPLPPKLTDKHQATDLGAFLFRTGLDKLPQLFNVLRGQMSLVGPRTISVTEVGAYGPWLSSMLTVKPGMTGPWAVRSTPTLGDEIRLTLYYIRNWTIWVDLQILFSTATRILQWRGRKGPVRRVAFAATSSEGETPRGFEGEVSIYPTSQIPEGYEVGPTSHPVENTAILPEVED
jgi:lipopolysaccharide/colanic/teichoic acid biosynthesis glycosyltransferase